MLNGTSSLRPFCGEWFKCTDMPEISGRIAGRFLQSGMLEMSHDKGLCGWQRSGAQRDTV